jgi:hypothetical protein
MIIPLGLSFSPRKKFRHRLFPIAIALFLIAFFGYILPSHHHTDGKEHTECSLCKLQSLPIENPIAVCILLIVFLIIPIISLNYQFYSPIFRSTYSGRAPPL